MTIINVSSIIPIPNNEIIWGYNDICCIAGIQIYYNQSRFYQGGELVWLYPPKLRICPTDKEGAFALIDETGWDNNQEVPHRLIGVYKSLAYAYMVTSQLLGWDTVYIV